MARIKDETAKLNIYQKIRVAYDIEMSTISKLLGFGVIQWRIYEREEKNANRAHFLLIKLISDPYIYRKILYDIPEEIIKKMGSKYIKTMNAVNSIISKMENTNNTKKVEEFLMDENTLDAVNAIVSNTEKNDKIRIIKKLLKTLEKS